VKSEIVKQEPTSSLRRSKSVNSQRKSQPDSQPSHSKAKPKPAMKKEPVKRQSTSKGSNSNQIQPSLSPPKTKTKAVKFQKSDIDMKEENVPEEDLGDKEDTADLSLLAFGQMIENKFK